MLDTWAMAGGFGRMIWTPPTMVKSQLIVVKCSSIVLFAGRMNVCKCWFGSRVVQTSRCDCSLLLALLLMVVNISLEWLSGGWLLYTWGLRQTIHVSVQGCSTSCLVSMMLSSPVFLDHMACSLQILRHYVGLALFVSFGCFGLGSIYWCCVFTPGNLLTHIILLFSLNIEKNFLLWLRRSKHAAWKGWWAKIYVWISVTKTYASRRICQFHIGRI
jgi:hypothetical protein